MKTMNSMKSINLLPRKPFIVRYQGPFARMIILLAIALLAFQFYLMTTWQEKVGRTQAQITAIEQELLPTEEENLQQRLRTAYQEALMKAEATAKAQVDWMAITGFLLGPLPGQAQMGDVMFNADGIQTQATFPSYAAAVTYVAELEKVPLFSSITVSQLSSQGTGTTESYLLAINIALASNGGGNP